MATYTKPKPAGTPTWTDLTTPDVDAARKFYLAVFGWEYDIGGPEYGGYTTARLGALPVAGLTSPWLGAPPQPAAWLSYFASDNAQADAARALAMGATVLAPAMQVGEFGSMAVLADPTGAPFGFWQAGRHIGWQIAEEFWAATWLELYSPDAKQARDFYTSLTGLTADPIPGGMEYYVLKRGEHMLAGIMQIDPAWGKMPAQWVTYFSVKNADETAATVKKHGGKQMGNVDDSPFGRIAALADPQGAVFKVVEPPKQ
jgi:predicted enzyme related to lactoylglutathione lyase